MGFSFGPTPSLCFALSSAPGGGRFRLLDGGVVMRGFGFPLSTAWGPKVDRLLKMLGRGAFLDSPITTESLFTIGLPGASRS